MARRNWLRTLEWVPQQSRNGTKSQQDTFPVYQLLLGCLEASSDLICMRRSGKWRPHEGRGLLSGGCGRLRRRGVHRPHGLGRIPWLTFPRLPNRFKPSSDVTRVRVKVFAIGWRSFWSPDRVFVLDRDWPAGVVMEQIHARLNLLARQAAVKTHIQRMATRRGLRRFRLEFLSRVRSKRAQEPQQAAGHCSGHANARAGRATALSGAAVQHAGREDRVMWEQNPAAKISASQVSEIRAAYRAGQLTQVELARAYGLGQSHISRITRGESWAE